ncbi:MAG: hypothetical protein SF028_11755 [Candidatus Sumerlaeia bacterium]|nr:hypothetical protein [Candidatus Sumerlaeia bacterium]
MPLKVPLTAAAALAVVAHAAAQQTAPAEVPFPENPAPKRSAPALPPALPEATRFEVGFPESSTEARPRRRASAVAEDGSMVAARNRAQEELFRLPPEEEAHGMWRWKVDSLADIAARMPTPEVLPRLSDEAKGASRSGQIFGSRWIELGPRALTNAQPTCCFFEPRITVSGRAISMAFDPSDPTWNTFYIGGAQGGVWKTTDGGASWTPLTDSMPNLTTGSLVVNPGATNEVWIGTGEYTQSGSSFSGSGFMYSNDSGATWTHRPAGSLSGSYISRVALDRATQTGPTRRMFAASASGLYETTDGFASAPTLKVGGGFTEVFQDLSNNSIWWAAGTNGLYKSTDNGATFVQETTTGFPTLVSQGRAYVVQAPSAPATMYACIATSSSQMDIFKTTDSGASWTQTDLGGTALYGSQYWYDIYIAVNPVDANEVYVGGVRVFRSTDGGATFANVATQRNIHDDHHFGIFAPDGSRYYALNDGGVFTTTDGGTSWTPLNAGLGLLQVNPHSIGLHPEEFQFIVGTQDNGTDRYVGSDEWHHVASGDGGFSMWDPQDPSYVYRGYVRAAFDRSTEEGWSNSYYGFDPPDDGTYPFYPAASISAADPNRVAIGSRRVYVALDARTNMTWQEKSTQLQNSSILALKFAPSDPEVMYVGYGNGRIYRTGNISAATPTWTLIYTHPSGTGCRDFAIDPTNPNRLVAVFYTFGSTRVVEITNANTTPVAVNRTSNLPSTAPRAVEIDFDNPSVWYIGGLFGVFRTADGGASWTNFATGLPNSVVMDLELDNSRSILLAGTHGRGTWMVSTPRLEALDPVVSDSGPGGNNNGDVDRNETFELTVPLQNTGWESATSVTATLASMTAGVTVTGSASAYPVLVDGGAAQNNSAPFTVTTDNSLTPGQVLEFELTVTSNGGDFLRTLPFTLRGGTLASEVAASEDFESGFGGFTASDIAGLQSWVLSNAKPASGSQSARIAEEPNGGDYNEDYLRGPSHAIPAGANSIQVAFDHTYAFLNGVYDAGGNLAGGRIELIRDGAAYDLMDPGAGVLSISDPPEGTVTATFFPWGTLPAYVNGATGLPYTRNTIELDPAVWAGTTFEIEFKFGFIGYSNWIPSQPSGWFVDNYSFAARTYSIMDAKVDGWQMF